ncbi:MAG: endonuclease/exonuclease/phosphatase family protein [Planctomycetota bacterium]
MPRLVSLLLLALLWASAPAHAAPERERLRVVSFNVWGLPWGISRQRAERIAALGPALAALKPDVVALQEVWVRADGEALTQALAAAGLVHATHEHAGLLGSGLLVASRYPIEARRFEPYELIGKLHKPYHGDAWARKGILSLTLRTPLGALRLVDTHVHASYGGSEYRDVQAAQLLQLAGAAGDFGANPPPERADAARPPLLLLGDLNVRADSLAFRLLCARADLVPASRELGIDWVLLRDGGGARWKVRKIQETLTDPVDLPSGARPLSDHPAVVADLELQRGPPARWDPPGAQRAWREAAAAARPWLTAQRDLAREWSGRWTGRAVFLTVVGALLLFASHRRSKKRGQCLLAALGLLLLHLAVWAMYLGVVHWRMQEVGLSNALTRLGPE